MLQPRVLTLDILSFIYKHNTVEIALMVTSAKPPPALTTNFSVTLLRFCYLFDLWTMVSAQRGHGQVIFVQPNDLWRPKKI